MTARLRIVCSTTELLWRIPPIALHGRLAQQNRRIHKYFHFTRDPIAPLKQQKRMPSRGLEPRRLSALPPQSSVSTNSTTRANNISTALPLQLHLNETPSTGATGLEPATSRVTVECSNQTELRPLTRLLLNHNQPQSRPKLTRQPIPTPGTSYSPNGSRTRLSTLKGSRPNR